MTKKALASQFNRQIQKTVKGIKKFSPDKIILYGSLARGDYNQNSDIDILVIKKKLTHKRMIDRMLQLDRYLEFGLPVEAVIFTPREIQDRLKQNDYFLAEALSEGKVLYEKK